MRADGPYVVELGDADRDAVALVGGKGAQLGALSRIEGVTVPLGFCITTRAFGRMVESTPSLQGLLEEVAGLQPEDERAIRDSSAQLRRTLEELPIPDDLTTAIARAHARLGEDAAWAVRSSATAEDLPTASFAGLQDTFLNVVGLDAVLRQVSRCWASLYTERAVTYRLRNGFDERSVALAVVVHRMVFPQASGVLFTADPVSGNRKVTTLEASYGLGEVLVSGRVNADMYKVRDGQIVSRAIGSKQVACVPLPGGGTQERVTPADLQRQPALTDAQVCGLAALGRRIEAHLGAPQDIEWCLAGGTFHIVQSRPITTLFPIPAVGEGDGRVWVSVGHQQMMTDAMRPLGLSLWQLKAMRPMCEAGGRLFVDVTDALASPSGRASLLNGLGSSDPLIGDALQTLVARGDFIPSQPEVPAAGPPTAAAQVAPPIETDPAIATALVARGQASVETLKRALQTRSGAELLDFIRAHHQELKRFLFDARGMQVIMAGIEAAFWLNTQLQAWLGLKNAADTFAQSVRGNVTSEMGLSLLDVADVLRPHPEVVAFLKGSSDDTFLEELPKLQGGPQARDAFEAWLDKYGARGVGEIDLTRPRFRERPTQLLPMVLGNVRNFPPGEAVRRFEAGLQRARALERDVLQRLRELPDGAQKAEETKRMIDRLRAFAGYREYPKYAWVCHDFAYKQALLGEAGRLVRAGVLRDEEDLFFLRFEELQDAVRTKHVDAALIGARKEAFRAYQGLTPPRVLTSDGESVTGVYRREDVPAGALVGLPVSAGIVEGRARVILDVKDADLEAGDILVTAFTDPSWTPLFVAIGGLVTEVGGLMTHGAVIAREYGLPAVVGVENATRTIRDGQRIRLDGAGGYVEVLTSG